MFSTAGLNCPHSGGAWETHTWGSKGQVKHLSLQKHTQHSCIFSPALILGWVMVAAELLEARRRDRRYCAPGWLLSWEHCPSSTPQLEQFSPHTNCADHPASRPWKDATESRGSHVPRGLQAPVDQEAEERVTWLCGWQTWALVSGRKGVHSQCHSLLSVWPWVRYSTSLSSTPSPIKWGS